MCKNYRGFTVEGCMKRRQLSIPENEWLLQIKKVHNDSTQHVCWSPRGISPWMVTWKTLVEWAYTWGLGGMGMEIETTSQPFIPLLRILCRWKPSPWSPFSDLFAKKQALNCLSSLSRCECKHSLDSFTLGFVDNTIALTASATISRCESPRRYPTEDFCGCSYASRAAQSYENTDRETVWTNICSR